MLRFVVLITLLFIISAINVFAVDKQEVPEYKQTKAERYLTSKEAYDVLKSEGSDILFLDVRTRAELSVVGMPTEADANVPFMLMAEPMTWNDEWGGFEMTSNPDFLNTVKQRLEEKGLNQNDRVFLMCRSGGRSAAAADVLTEAGFSQVYSIVDGFEGDMAKNGERSLNGWKNSKLPWSYQLDKSKMYLQKCENQDLC